VGDDDPGEHEAEAAGHGARTAERADGETNARAALGGAATTVKPSGIADDAMDVGGAADVVGTRPPQRVQAAEVQADARWRHVDARSVAEATLFEALEATPATAGRFALNESLAVRFGGMAAEVDLLSRGDRIAIEIDGVHHFADLDGYRRDRKKDVLLQAQGLFVVRVLADDVMHDVRGAVNVVVQALAYRRKERG
jgi:very-short-patch-repair endonuclease